MDGKQREATMLKITDESEINKRISILAKRKDDVPTFSNYCNYMPAFAIFKYMADNGALPTLEGSVDGLEVICGAMDGKIKNAMPCSNPYVAICKTFIEWMELKIS
jgi:hypothetical protein